jgi:protein gp37
MAENSKIQWTDHTFNPWRGCTKVSAGCKNCYAETMSGRNPGTLGVWGPKGTRVVASESYWRQPLKWNREAKAAGERRRVFCASLADVFEGWDTMPAASHDAVMAARKRLGKLINDTPYLDWLLLTKRPENVLALAADMWVRFVRDAPLPVNVWIGTSVENQETADKRIPELLKVPAAVRFLSCEPLLGPIDFFHGPKDWGLLTGIHWVIVGGESGPGARPCDVNWIRSIVGQCRAAGVEVFVKQLGAQPHDTSDGSDRPNAGTLIDLNDRKGGDLAEFPPDLRVREFPTPASAQTSGA